MAPALPMLKKIISQNDKESLADACWAFSYLSDGDDNRIMVRFHGPVVAVSGHTLHL